MQVGIDTYVTLEEADKYIKLHYPYGNSMRKKWEQTVVSDDREVLLISACCELEALSWNGFASDDEQLLSFPRKPDKRRFGTFSVPAAIKNAQTELALWLCAEIDGGEASKRAALKAQGVTSFTLGDLSESYDGKSALPSPLICGKCEALISRYLAGGFEVC